MLTRLRHFEHLVQIKFDARTLFEINPTLSVGIISQPGLFISKP